MKLGVPVGLAPVREVLGAGLSGAANGLTRTIVWFNTRAPKYVTVTFFSINIADFDSRLRFSV